MGASGGAERDAQDTAQLGPGRARRQHHTARADPSCKRARQRRVRSGAGALWTQARRAAEANGKSPVEVLVYSRFDCLFLDEK